MAQQRTQTECGGSVWWQASQLSPELEGGSSFATRTASLVFSSQKRSGIINKSTASLSWQRACILIAMPPYICSETLRWWEAHGSLCIFCSARELLCSPIAAWSQAARLGSSPGSHGDCWTPLHHLPQVCRERESRPLPRWDQSISLCYPESRPAIAPLCNSHGSPWLVIALTGSNPSIFKTSVLLRPRLAVFSLKSWFYNIVTCGSPAEIDNG